MEWGFHYKWVRQTFCWWGGGYAKKLSKAVWGSKTSAVICSGISLALERKQLCFGDDICNKIKRYTCRLYNHNKPKISDLAHDYDSFT